LRFDAKQIEAPDQEAQEFMNQVNRVDTAPEKETVPAGKPETAPQGQQARESPQATPSSAGKARHETPQDTTAGNGNSGLFGRDEEAALAEQYERAQAGYNGPDFAN
jgi:hypothetical protein